MEDKYFTSATVWMIVWILIGLSLTLTSSLLAARAMFPGLSRRCGERMRRPVVPVLAGAGVAIAGLVIAATLQKAGPPGQVLSLVLAAAALSLALIGASGLVHRLASSCLQPGEDVESWAAQRRGATILTLSWLLPVAGTFLILPLSLLSGLGSAVLSLKKPARVPPLPASTLPPLPENYTA